MPVRVKICGLTRPEDAELAAASGAWALGVVFAPESSRRLSVDEAVRVLGAAAQKVEKVGVFVNADIEEIAGIVEACGLTAVQLHGEESAEECIDIRERTGSVVIKAIRVSGAESMERVVQFDTDYVLLDTYQAERRGGTGQAFDWAAATRLPGKTRASRIILSGGLNPDNVAEAVRVVAPFAIDISSGIEVSPGIKDHRKLQKIFDILDGIHS